MNIVPKMFMLHLVVFVYNEISFKAATVIILKSILYDVTFQFFCFSTICSDDNI